MLRSHHHLRGFVKLVLWDVYCVNGCVNDDEISTSPRGLGIYIRLFSKEVVETRRWPVQAETCSFRFAINTII